MANTLYGDVVAIGKTKVTVQLDRLTRTVRVPPCLLLIVEG